jgi:hypothetical protein
VRKDSGIKSVTDLKKKKVNLGRKGSAQRMLTEALFDAMGMQPADFAQLLEIEADEQLDALCSGKLDAAFYVIAHPVSIVPEAAQRCNAQMIEVEGANIRELTEKNPAYALMNIPGGLYPGNPKPMSTFGLKAVFVSEARLPNDQAYALVKAVFENFERFQRLHPTLETLSREEIAKGSSIAPLHDGALKFYREAKLVR